MAPGLYGTVLTYLLPAKKSDEPKILKPTDESRSDLSVALNLQEYHR